MGIVGLQETLWFGTNSYQVDDCLVLASGRPSHGELARQGEGVAIVLRGCSGVHLFAVARSGQGTARD